MSRKLLAIVVASGLMSAASLADGDVAMGKVKSQMCVGCHNIPNYSIAFPVVYKVPKIQGQSAAYIKYSLMEYAAGNRYHPPEANKIASMPAIAGSLTEQDMDDLAAYYSSLGE